MLSSTLFVGRLTMLKMLMQDRTYYVVAQLHSPLILALCVTVPLR